MKVEVAALGSPSLISLVVSVDLTAEDFKPHIIIVDMKAIPKRKSL